MKKTILMMIFCLFSLILYCQEVISVSGEQVKNSTIQMSWTIGEPVVETIGNSELTLTQGFHQSYLSVTTTREIQKPNFSISAFPNPAADYIELKVEGKTQKKLLFQLFDSNGKLLLEDKFLDNNATIQTVNLLPAVYFIKINEGQDNIQTFQIIKK